MKRNAHKSIRGLMIVALLAAVFAVCFSGMACAAEYMPGEALVLLKNGIGEMSAASLERSAGDGYVKSVASKAGASVIKTYNALSMESGSIFVHMKSDTKTTDELIAELKSNPDVLGASPNYIRRALRTPVDPEYTKQWALPTIGATTAWDISTGSPDVYVAVIDSGIARNHEDLQDNLDINLSRNFVTADGSINDFDDGNGHGTHVSGIIGAVGSNDKGIAGINWEAKIISLRVLDDAGEGDTGTEMVALDYVAELLSNDKNMNLPAINLSLGGWGDFAPQELIDTRDPYWEAYKTLDDLNRTVIVIAAGNDALEVGAPAPFDVGLISKGDYCYPASLTGLNNLIVVGSTNKTDGASAFTNWSSEFVHIAAPGGEDANQATDGILSTVPVSIVPGGYDFMSGTSMAAPHVAGAVALLASEYPDSTASQLKNHVLAKANGNANPNAPAVDFKSKQAVPVQVAKDRKVSIHGRLDLTNLLSDAPADIKVTSITLSGAATMTVGKTQTLTATVKPDSATDKTLNWTTSDSTVATVSSSGLVEAVKDGDVTITATAKADSTVSDSMAIKVGSSSNVTSSGSSGCATGVAGLAGIALALFFVRRNTSGKKD